MQFQADLLNCKILRPKVVESTAQGAAYLAGVSAGIWRAQDLKKFLKQDQIFVPRMPAPRQQSLYRGWLKAVEQTRIL